MVINKQLTASATAAFTVTNFLPERHGSGVAIDLRQRHHAAERSEFRGERLSAIRSRRKASRSLCCPPRFWSGRPAIRTRPAGPTSVAVNTSLSWKAGTNATLHRVYFGTSSNAVGNAYTNSPEFKGALAGASFAPGVLAASGRFYWRVDEMAGTNVATGPVWTFATVVSGAGTIPVGRRSWNRRYVCDHLPQPDWPDLPA